MNRLDTRHAAEVMLHEADGGKVERLDLNNMQSGWLGHVVGHWDWTSFDYRKAVSPRSVWVSYNKSGSICSVSSEQHEYDFGENPILFREVIE